MAGGQVADLGCGPGHVGAYLHGLGPPVVGVDLSPAMIDIATRTYPGMRFQVGSMLDLDLPDASPAGVVALYSIIHIPTAQPPRVFAEVHRALSPGGQALFAFQTGDGSPTHRDRRVARPPRLAHRLVAAAGRRHRPPRPAGLPVHARLHRDPGEAEARPRAYVFARKGDAVREA